MSNVPMGSIPLSSVVDPLADYSTKPSYLVQKTSVENAYFQVVTLSNYSESLLNCKVQLSNADSQILDRVVVATVPIQFNISGSRSSGNKLLQDGQFGVRSNAMSKAINTATISVASTASYSVPSDNGILVSALEQSAPMGWAKYFENFDSQVFDNACNYDDNVGGLRNVLSIYRNGFGPYLGRAAYDITILSNTAVSATILVNFRFAVLLSPLLTNISVHGPAGPAFSHIDNLVLNLQMQNLNTRCLSFARDALGDRLSITNIQPLIGPNSGVAAPIIEFTTYNLLDMAVVPSVVNYNIQMLDRYALQFNQAPADGFRIVSGPSVTLDTVPSYVLIFACHPMSNYTSQSLTLNDNSIVHGSQLTDTFCAINQCNVQIAGRNMLNQSSPQTLWKMCVQNGLESSFMPWSGLPLIQSSDPVTYTAGQGAVLKLNFDTDLKLYNGSDQLSAGTNYKFLFQANIGVKNIYSLTNNQLSLYYVFVYPSLLQISGVNSSKLIQAPLTPMDCANATRQAPTAHYSQVVNHDLMGFGLHNKLHKHMAHHRGKGKTKRARMIRQHMKDFAAHMPVVHHQAGAMSGGAYSAGASSGGARHRSRSRPKKQSLKFA